MQLTDFRSSKKYRALTVGAEYHGSMYQTEWPITIQKIPCIFVGAEYHGSMYQSGRLPSKNTVHYRGV